MADALDRVKKGFSETRTIILGAQILLGFQYQALFQPGFKELPDWAKVCGAVSYGLLLMAIGCMIGPTPFHRLAEHGRATSRLCRYLDTMLLVSLVPFAAALALNVTTATTDQLGPWGAAAGIGSALLALFMWFGLELIKRSRSAEPRRSPQMQSEDMPLKDRISQLLEQSRIILPGVQALLGFQFAAYLSQGFKDLPDASKAAHTAALFLLIVAMILLMTPTPYHRLGERGEETEDFDRAGTSFVLSALVPLTLAVAADFYIVLQKVTENGAVAIGGALVAVLGALVLWLAVPLAARAKS